MPRFAPLIVTALLLAAPAPQGAAQPTTAASDSTQAAPAGFANPRETFDAAQAAFNERDWGRFLSCVVPEQRSGLVGATVAALEFVRQQPNADPRVAELLNGFFPGGVPENVLAPDAAVRQSATTQLVEGLDDPADFFAAASNLAMALEHGERANDVRVETLGDLKAVKTAKGASNRAVRAAIAMSRPDTEKLRRDVWIFMMLDQRWYLAPLGVE